MSSAQRVLLLDGVDPHDPVFGRKRLLYKGVSDASEPTDDTTIQWTHLTSLVSDSERGYADFELGLELGDRRTVPRIGSMTFCTSTSSSLSGCYSVSRTSAGQVAEATHALSSTAYSPRWVK